MKYGIKCWCDFGANLVQHFMQRYSRYSRYRTKSHDKATISNDITRYSRYQTVLLKLQEIISFWNYFYIQKALLMQSFFHVSSVITTTGFGIADFTLWPTASQYVLVLLMFVGACAGSTGGAIKVARVIILLKSIRRSINKMIRPNQVELIRLNGTALDEMLSVISKSTAPHLPLIFVRRISLSFIQPSAR